MPFRFRHRGRSVPTPMHSRRAHIHDHADRGARVADAVARGMGSWRFIITMTVFIIIWMTLNVVALVRHWDPYPWVLLNLIFSTQASYSAPIILMSQNRQAARDRKRDDTEAAEVEDSLVLTQNIHGLSKEIHAMVTTQHKILAILDPTSDTRERDERISRGAAGRADPDDEDET